MGMHESSNNSKLYSITDGYQMKSCAKPVVAYNNQTARNVLALLLLTKAYVLFSKVYTLITPAALDRATKQPIMKLSFGHKHMNLESKVLNIYSSNTSI